MIGVLRMAKRSENKERSASLPGISGLCPAITRASTLPPPAQRILKAAKDLLVAEGFNALTLEALAARAGVNKAATRYYFGSKAGLIEAIVDEIVLEECAAIAYDLEAKATPEERIDAFIENVRRVATNVESFNGFFDIFPHALRDERLRKRLTFLYDLWYSWNVEWLFAGNDGIDPELRHLLQGFGRLAAAAADGIAVQASIHEHYDAEPVLEALRECFVRLLR